MEMLNEHIEIDLEQKKYYDNLLDCQLIFMSLKGYKALHDRLYEVFGSGASTILYEMGLEIGKNIANQLRHKLGNPLKKALLSMEHFEYMGWGKIRINKKELLKMATFDSMNVIVENCFIPKGVGKTGTRTCHLLRGIFVGALKVMRNKDYVCEETKCVAKGDSFCEFSIRKSSG
jgi:predicted hydrocarbon binding protein